MLIRHVTLASTILIALAVRASSPQVQAVFTLEIPELKMTLQGDSSGLLPRTDFNTFRIMIRGPQISYGSIRSKINTESAGIIMDAKSIGDGIVCSFDLSRHAGFRFGPGRNSVEIEAVDSRNRVFYSSFLLSTSAPAQSSLKPAAPHAPEDIQGREKYAVIIGVSRYRDPAIPKLQFADRDAQAIRDFLLSPEGGSFPSENIMYLVNEDASTKNVRTALYTFLTKPTRNDVVVIYFAGHGSPDPNDRRNLYLLTYDSEIHNMGGSAFPMWEVQDVFARIVKAQHLVTLTDACHSAGISGESAPKGAAEWAPAGLQRDLQIQPGNNLINQYISRYGSEGQRAVLTASDIGESSIEGEAWGGGHGVFTHFVLEGLKGKADQNADETVTAGELFEYVRAQVVKATDGRQNPTALAGLARDLPLSGRALRRRSN